MRNLVRWMIGLTLAMPVWAGNVAEGTFFYGRAEPTLPPAESRYEQLSFELEHCGSIVRTRWYDANRVLLAVDELEAPAGRLKRYRYWRPNVDERVEMDRDGEMLLIERHDADRLRSVRLPAGLQVAAGPLLLLDAVRDRSSIAAGRPLQVSYAVPEQMATYDMSLTRMQPSPGPDGGIVVTASSWLVRPFMHPVELYFDRRGELARVRGRVLPVMGRPGRAEPLDADARVERSEVRACSDQPNTVLTDH